MKIRITQEMLDQDNICPVTQAIRTQTPYDKTEVSLIDIHLAYQDGTGVCRTEIIPLAPNYYEVKRLLLERAIEWPWCEPLEFDLVEAEETID